MYVQRGIDPDVATDMVNEVMQDPELALETHAREELGINPSETGNPLQAAASSFVAFAIGAVIPLLPWLFTSGTKATLWSVVLGAVAAVTVGAALAVFTGRSWFWSAGRQLLISGVAAGITYGIGHVLGGG
jgi:VIT1/CCC1 family predicted Fe2+/Mn2+ transporter